MTNVLARYLSRAYVARLLAVLLGLAGLLQLVELMERSDEILERGLGAVGVLTYATLRFPQLLAPVLPIASLAAAILTFSGLAGRGELEAMRASGVAVTRMVAWLLPAGLLVALAQFLVADQAAPLAERAFRQWWGTLGEGQALWFRQGHLLVGVERLQADGRLLFGVSLHERDGDGRLVAVTRAARAEAGPDGWRLDGVRRQPVTGPEIAEDHSLWPEGPDPSNLAELGRAEPVLSTARLAAVLEGRRVGDRPPEFYRVRLWDAFAAPAASLVMILLATPAAGALRRGGGIPAGMGVGLAAGLSYLVLDGILAALGEAGRLPAALAALTPPALFACVGGAMMLRAEG